MENIETFTILALLVAKLVDTLRNATDPNGAAPKVVWNIGAFVVGIIVAFSVSLNIFGPLGMNKSVGIILSGFLLGAGGSGWHELLDFLSGKAKGR